LRLLLPSVIPIEKGIKDELELVFLEAVFIDVIAHGFGDVVLPLENRIDSDPKEILEHPRNEPL
jgi:hypothetical protein